MDFGKLPVNWFMAMSKIQRDSRSPKFSGIDPLNALFPSIKAAATTSVPSTTTAKSENILTDFSEKHTKLNVPSDGNDPISGKVPFNELSFSPSKRYPLNRATQD